MRKLADGCSGCGMSLVYCHCVRELERRACCDDCRHGDEA